jgi:hypothetical protein
VVENRVLRRIFGPKRDEVTGQWRKLHSGELQSRWVGHVACMGEGRNVYKVLVGKPEGKRPLERARRRWEDRLKMDLREMGWGVWSGFTWLRLGIVGGLL